MTFYLRYLIFAFFIFTTYVSGACQLNSDYQDFRPAGVCIGNYSLNDRKEKILARLDKKPLKIKTINASINHFAFKINKIPNIYLTSQAPSQPTQSISNAPEKEFLYVVITSNNSTFSVDVTHFDAVVFDDGMIVFPGMQDFGTVIRHSQLDAQRVDKIIQDFVKNFHTKMYKQMTLLELLSDLNVPIYEVFGKDSSQNIQKYITIKVNTAQNEAGFSGMLHKGFSHAINLLHTQFPNVKKLTLHQVPGTYSLTHIFDAAILVRSFGFDTYLKKNSRVFSAGVDLFFSGVNHYFEEGAILKQRGWQDKDVEINQGDPGSKDHPVQLMTNDVHSLLNFPHLYILISENLDSKNWYDISTQELIDMGAIQL